MIFRKPQQERLVIADDYPIFRYDLRRLLESDADLNVVGEASDGAEAVTLVRQLKPDILLLDSAMPKHSGLEALRELSAPADAIPVRMMTLAWAAEKSEIVEALQLGARGVVYEDSVAQLLLKAIQTVLTGECWGERRAFPISCSICERSWNSKSFRRWSQAIRTVKLPNTSISAKIL
jgi:DNA-binding NarL/FixJ family response regulator